MFTNTPSDRVQLVGLGELLSPAKCMICGNGTCEGGYARLGVWYDYEGEQYLCRTCTIQVAELFNCLTPEEAQHLQDEAAKLAKDASDLSYNLGVANERLAVYDSAISDAITGNPDLVRIAAGINSETADSERSPVGVDAETSGEPDSGESESQKPVKKSDNPGTSGSELRNDAPERVIPKL